MTEITVSKSQLNEALVLLSKVVPDRPTHPVIANILIDKIDGDLVLTGYDLARGMKLLIQADIAPDFKAFTVPGKMFASIISKLDAEEIKLIATTKEDDVDPFIEIKTDSSSFNIRGLNSEEYPSLPVTTDEFSTLSLPCTILKEAIKKVVFCASIDETKQILTGIYIQLNYDEAVTDEAGNTTTSVTFTSVATDGHRLAIFEKTFNVAGDKSEEETASIVLPAADLKILYNFLDLSQEDIELRINENICIIKNADNNYFYSRVLDGNYPAYKQLIPPEFVSNIIFNRKTLIDALGRISLFADKKNNVVMFTIDQQLLPTLSLFIESKDVGNAVEQVTLDKSENVLEDNKTIALNLKYIADAFKNFEDKDITMLFNKPTTPIIFKSEQDNLLCLVMPISVRQ